jgi:hypothetical protein
MLAAVLALGAGAVLSHRSAAALWGFWPPDAPMDVTAPSRRRRADVRTHLAALRPEDITQRRGIPVTMPARTLLDLADVVSGQALRRAVNEALIQRRASVPGLKAQLERDGDRLRAAARLRAILAYASPTRSELEDRTLELIAQAGLPLPRSNVRLDLHPPVEVDFLYSTHRLVLEADGHRFHSTKIAREDDARRQARIEAAGYLVMRLTWEDVTQEPGQTVRRLRNALA